MKHGKRHCVALLGMVLAFLGVPSIAPAQGIVLHTETEIVVKEPVHVMRRALRMNAVSPVPRQPDQIPSHSAAARVVSSFVGETQALPTEKLTENLLEKMDVYALSPHARQLALPRMVSPQMKTDVGFAPSLAQVSATWGEIIRQASRDYQLDPNLVAAVIQVESNFDVSARSPKGAQGLMQIMPATQRELGLMDPYDAETNIMAGARYLKQQLDRFGTVELALAAYNAGPGNVAKYGDIPPFAETRSFVSKVIEKAAQPLQ